MATRTEFYLNNLVLVLDQANVRLTYGQFTDVTLGDIMEHIPDMSQEDRIELFDTAIDLIEARTVLDLLATEEALLISRVDVVKVQENFQALRDITSGLLTESSTLKDYKVNYKALKELKQNLKLVKS